MEKIILKTLIGVAAGGKRPEYIDLDDYGTIVISGGNAGMRYDLIENIRFRKPVIMRRFNAFDEECLADLERISRICSGVDTSTSDSPMVVQLLDGDCELDEALQAIIEPIIRRGRVFQIYLMVTAGSPDSGIAGFVNSSSNNGLRVDFGPAIENTGIFSASIKGRESGFNLAIPYGWTIDDVRECKNEGAPELEEAVLPCYGVNVTWGKGAGARHTEELYPDGMGDIIDY